ncbi:MULTISPECIES: hypothetical protein [Streptomyces]|uniref:Uncharacterized protein n=1 Tax=Streptomyces canarius TaxID=285453 RepID=A0ABQ3CGK7_9ACTN|nr:hypothetical protein [Streptomyces canarius]AEY88534.1 hypothetical protein SHJG_3260 [Streptomyces hygroscopicus subsp. jinggangensis 5008]AGF62691.1 hypothetical protein SHJGH_3025 [Streptomyces hygroscopicus subsp. jinggangensis TL01]ALO92963.1 hypothetical protein SHL15_1801 [Streptomyces hygroscopicus subsp. limoneus]GHA10924.1 hypothetical protein GCM10010345_14200 [Streptomyces canarius]
MAARTHSRPHPATTGGVDIRLPWWALALPALAFLVLLALILNPSDAHAATGDPAITRLLERAQQLLAR